MTSLLEQAVDTARNLPPQRQDEIAQIMLLFAGDESSLIELSDEEYASFDISIEQANRGEFASDDEIKAIWARHGL